MYLRRCAHDVYVPLSLRSPVSVATNRSAGVPTVEYIALKIVGAIIRSLTFFSSEPMPMANGRVVNYSAPPVFLSSAFFLTLHFIVPGSISSCVFFVVRRTYSGTPLWPTAAGDTKGNGVGTPCASRPEAPQVPLHPLLNSSLYAVVVFTRHQ